MVFPGAIATHLQLRARDAQFRSVLRLPLSWYHGGVSRRATRDDYLGTVRRW